MHLDCGIEFWNKDSSTFKKFNSLEEMIYEKNAIAATRIKAKRSSGDDVTTLNPSPI